MRMPALLLALLIPLSFSAASLNDTGQDRCYEGGALAVCSEANAGDAAAYPRQDGRFGRDAQAAAGQLAKTGAGAAGFDFTPLDAAGSPIALSGGVPASTPACVRDNRTGLLWEVKTAANAGAFYTFAQAASYATDTNTNGLCGYSSGWRVPARRELLSIVHHGTYSPAIDTDFFPNTRSRSYWSSDVYAPDPTHAWGVYFYEGFSFARRQSYNRVHVRLVRSGQ